MDNKLKFSNGYMAIFEAMKDPASVQLYQLDGVNYVMSEAVENYMSASITTEIPEAIKNIAEANGVESDSIVCIGDFDDDYLPDEDENEGEGHDPTEEEVQEATILLEKSAEDGAMTLQQAMKWYNGILKTCKSKAETVAQINDCIKTLNSAINQMEKQLEKSSTHMIESGKMKYALKSLIPFNGLARLFKRNDWRGFYSNAMKAFENPSIIITIIADKLAQGHMTNKQKANVAGWAAFSYGYTMFCRYSNYTAYLKEMIKATKEAVKYLEKKKESIQNKEKNKAATNKKK